MHPSEEHGKKINQLNQLYQPMTEHVYSSWCSLYISYGVDKENSVHDQELLKLVIISLMCDLRVILWGKIRC